MSNQETTKKTNNNESIARIALKNYPLALKKMAPWLLNVFLVGIAVLALGFLSVYSLYFTIPFVIVPFLFALQLTHSYIHIKDDMDGKRFTYYFKSYFSPMGFGSYRIIRSAVYSILYSLLGSIIFFIVYSYIAEASGAQINQALTALFDAYKAMNVDEMNRLLASEPILSLMKWSAVVESLIFILSFIFHILRYGILAYFHLSMPGADARSVNVLYKRALRSINAKGYNKDYFSSLWPVILIVLLSLGLGIFLGELLSNVESISLFFERSDYFSEETFILIFGMSVTSIFAIFLLPYYFEVISLIYQKYEVVFGETAFEFANEALNELKTRQKLSEEEQKQIEKSIEELKKKKEEMFKDAKDDPNVVDNPDDDSKNN